MLYAIMVPHRSLNFTWHHFTLSLSTSEPQFYLASFYPLPILSTVFIAFPYFFSILLCQSPGHTSKQQFFHCFSIVSRMLYAIMVPHRSLNFTWHHFTLSLSTSEPQFYLASFYPLPILSTVFIAFPCFFHSFMSKSLLFPLFLSSYVIFPHFFYCFSHQSAQIHLGGRTRGESIPQRHPIATWYITLKKVYLVHLFYHLFSSFLSLSGRSAPRPP